MWPCLSSRHGVSECRRQWQYLFQRASRSPLPAVRAVERSRYATVKEKRTTLTPPPSRSLSRLLNLPSTANPGSRSSATGRAANGRNLSPAGCAAKSEKSPALTSASLPRYWRCDNHAFAGFSRAPAPLPAVPPKWLRDETPPLNTAPAESRADGLPALPRSEG